MSTEETESKYNPEVTKKLEVLRKEAGRTLVQAAAYFGYNRGETIGAWEKGIAKCPETDKKRPEFIDYLLNGLGLRKTGQGIEEFLLLWNALMVNEWEWDPLNLGELDKNLPHHVFRRILAAIVSLPPGQPPDFVQHFTGREKELKQLLEVLHPGVVITVWGPGGIGKSALIAEAIHKLTLANDLPERFPDGIIRYNFDENHHARNALIHIVSSFNVPFDPANPGSAVDRALSRKRVLLILEGTENADELDAVLSRRNQCGVVITTRKKEHFMLGAQRISLDPFEIDEGVELLKKWAGTQILNDNIAEEICKWVGGLPLAIQLAGSYIERNKGDDEANVDKVALEYLNWLKEKPFEALELVQKLLEKSKAQLDSITKQLLKVIGFLAPVPFDQQVIVEVLATSSDKIRRPLDELINYSLLKRVNGGYEVVHNLIHTYASQEAIKAPSEITERLVAYYTKLIELVETRGKPGEKKDYAKLDTVRPHIIATLAKVVERQEWQAAINLAQAIDNYLKDQGHWTERLPANKNGLTAAKNLEDRRYECIFRAKLGRTLDVLGREDEAKHCLEQEALPISQEIKDQILESQIWEYLGTVNRHQWEVETAIKCYNKAREVVQEITETDEARSREEISLCSQGRIFTELGQLEEAIKCIKQALEISCKVGNLHRMSIDLGYLGATYITLKQPGKAIEYYEQALVIARRISDLRGEGNQLLGLGKANDFLGKEKEARENYEQALVIANTDFRMEIDARAGLAHIYARQGQQAEALIHIQKLESVPDFGGSLWAYLKCYKVLRDSGESRAQTILETAYDLLTKRADKINDDVLRHSFLNNVPVNKEIRDEFEKSQME